MEDIKILLNSHAHIDHAGGLAMLKEITGAKLFASEADAQSLAIGDRENPHWGDRLTFAAVKTDRLLRDGDTVEIGGVSLVARLTPGHTKGNTTWTMKVKDETSTYHVVFAGSMSAPGFTLVDNAKYPSILADYEKSFRLLQSLPCDIFLSSHGQFFDLKRKSALLEKGVKPNPFIDQKGFLNYVRYNEKAFRDELQKQRQAKVKSQG